VAKLYRRDQTSRVRSKRRFEFERLRPVGWETMQLEDFLPRGLTTLRTNRKFWGKKLEDWGTGINELLDVAPLNSGTVERQLERRCLLRKGEAAVLEPGLFCSRHLRASSVRAEIYRFIVNLSIHGVGVAVFATVSEAELDGIFPGRRCSVSDLGDQGNARSVLAPTPGIARSV